MPRTRATKPRTKPVTSADILAHLCRREETKELADTYLFVLAKWNQRSLPTKVEYVCAYLASEQ